MLSSVPLWLHVLGAAVWVGSQVMMFVVVIPSLRTAEPATRGPVLAAVTKRFGYLGLAALLLLALTGLDNLNRYAPSDLLEFRYGSILAVKLVMFAAIVVLTAVHALYLGPKLLALQTRLPPGDSVADEAMRSLRARSVGISVAVLLLSLAILFCGVLLGSAYAYG